MSLAYLVLAHHQPELLARLVERLLDRDVHVFVHVDARSRIQLFEEALSGISSPWRSQVHLADRRIGVRYFGFSMVRATLSLMKQAVDFDRFSYYSLLSGADYPIKPRAHIREVLASGDTQYIVYWKLEDRPSWRHKIEYYFLTDYIPIRNLEPPSLRRPWKIGEALRYHYWRMFYRHRQQFPKRTFPFDDVVPYGGSQWWSLTHGCVTYILEEVSRRPELTRFYRFTEAPDELFFQTIVLNSPFREKAANWERYQRWSAETAPADKTDESRIPEGEFNLRYIDWSGPYRGERGYPYVLDERDFPQLRETDCLFARKFDLERSARLMDRIDRDLLGRETEGDAAG